MAEEQAVTDRDAGTLLVRDAGAVHDTRWLQQRADMPRIIRAGRHIARTRRYLRGFAVEVEPEDLVEAVRKQARAGDGWVKLVGDWIDRDAGDLTPSFPAAARGDAVRAAHDEGARVTAHCFAEDTLDDMLDAGIDCIEHATGLLPRHLPRFVEQGVPIVPTLINIATFPDIAAQAEQKFPRYAAHMRALWERRANGPRSLRGRRRRSTPERTRAASSSTAGSWTKSRRCTPPGSRHGRPSTPAPGPARAWLGADGHHGRCQRRRRLFAGGPARSGPGDPAGVLRRHAVLRGRAILH